MLQVGPNQISPGGSKHVLTTNEEGTRSEWAPLPVVAPVAPVLILLDVGEQVPSNTKVGTIIARKA